MSCFSAAAARKDEQLPLCVVCVCALPGEISELDNMGVGAEFRGAKLISRGLTLLGSPR